MTCTLDKDEDIGFTTEPNMTLTTAETRYIFTAVYLPLFVIAFVGNVLAIYYVSKRKYRCIQKTQLISLALSDLVAATSISVNNLETFSHPMYNWTMGEFMCGAIPVLQVFGVLVSSVAVVAIALDRYRNVVQAMNKRWDPSPILCFSSTIALWILCAGISYPMNTFYSHKPIKVVYLDENQNPYCEIYWMCVSFVRRSITIYYISMTIVIFSPLVFVFIWMYWNIAKLIWIHRKPVTSTNNYTSNIENSVTKSTDINPGAGSMKPPKVVTFKKKNFNVERKIRSFKIIVVLLLVFILCRLPYWIFYVVKLSTKLNGHMSFCINYGFIALSLLNCAINPFIYAFLTPFLRFIQTTYDLFCKICCCCFSDFDELVKDNPFVASNLELMAQNKSNNKASKQNPQVDSQGKY